MFFCRLYYYCVRSMVGGILDAWYIYYSHRCVFGILYVVYWVRGRPILGASILRPQNPVYVDRPQRLWRTHSDRYP